MAYYKNNILLEGASGKIGKQIVVKNYADKTVVSKYPDMSKVKWSAKQNENRSIFAQANAYAKELIKDADKKAELLKRAKPGQSAYNVAVSEYMSFRKD